MDKPAVYRIKVQGVVPESWTDRLGAMDIVSVTSAATTLEGWLPDQAALNGVLDTLYQLHLPLLEVICLPHERPAVSESHEDEKNGKKYGQHIDLIMKDGKIFKNTLGQ